MPSPWDQRTDLLPLAQQVWGGIEISEARRLKELETENSRLKKLVADQALDIQILKEVNSKQW